MTGLFVWSLLASVAVASGQIGIITVTYEGIEVTGEETYRFGQFGTLECAVESNLEDLTYTWTEVNGTSGEVSVESKLLVVNEEMVEAEINIWRCVVTDTLSQETETGRDIEFTALSRVEGKAPTKDLTYTSQEDEELPQIPCQMPPGWQVWLAVWELRKPNGEVNYVFLQGGVITGYSIVQRTNPYDGHINLVIEDPTPDKTGIYTCIVNGWPIGSSVEFMIMSDIHCPRPVDGLIGSNVVFACGATITGSVEPQFLWVINETEEDGNNVDLPGQPGPPFTRQRQNNFVRENIDESFDSVTHQCIIDLPTSSSGAEPAGQVATCDAAVNVVLPNENVIVRYEGILLTGEDTYRLGQFGTLECSVESNEDDVNYTWIDINNPFSEVFESSLLVINEEMVASVTNTFRCVVTNTTNQETENGLNIEFTAVRRVEGIAPSQDLAYTSQEGEDLPQIPCQIPPGSQGQLIQWELRRPDGGGIVYINGDFRRDGFTIVETVPDDGHRNLVIEEPTLDKVGIYSCVIDGVTIGSMEFMMLSDIQCPRPVDGLTGSDVVFTCAATITGSVEPQFLWVINETMEDGNNVDLPNQPDMPFTRQRQNNFVRENIDESFDSVTHQCIIDLPTSTSGAEPAGQVATCDAAVNVVFPSENITVLYNGWMNMQLTGEETYRLAQHAYVLCLVLSNPDDFIYTWIDVNNPVAVQSTRIFVTEEMVEAEINTWRCVVTNKMTQERESGPNIEFTAVVREDWRPGPWTDVAVSTGERVEIPCTQQLDPGILVWYYSATGNTADRERIYSTDEPDHLEPGYEIYVTHPDDQFRNLIIPGLTGATAGSYTCEITWGSGSVQSTTVAITSIGTTNCAVACGGAECNAFLGDTATFVCTVELYGPAVPSFQWKDNNGESCIGFLAGGGPMYTYLHTRTVTGDMHEEPFTCLLSLEPTGEVLPVPEQSMCESVITIQPSVGGIRLTYGGGDLSDTENAVLGENYWVDCLINTFYIVPEFQWVRNSDLGPATVDGPEFRVTEEMIDRENGDVTSYTCQVRDSNGDGEVLGSMDAVFIAGYMDFIVTLTYEGQILDPYASIGDVEVGTEIECSVSNKTFPFAQFRWVKWSGPGPNEVITSNRYDHSNFLTITNGMVSEDSMESSRYLCRVTNGLHRVEAWRDVAFRAVPAVINVIDECAGSGQHTTSDGFVLAFTLFMTVLVPNLYHIS